MDIATELRRYLDDSSIADNVRPKLIVVMGGIGAGKSTLRRSKYATGFVVVDAGLIFENLTGNGPVAFPGDLDLERRMWTIGRSLAGAAIAERRHIVIEIIGAHEQRLRQLIEAMRSIDYELVLEFVACDPSTALTRSEARTMPDVSAFDSEPYQLAWLHAEALAIRQESALERSGLEVAQLTPAQEDCLNAINAMNVAVDRMRASGDDGRIPQQMATQARDAFVELDGSGELPLQTSVAAADLLYRRIAELETLDRFTTSYVSIAVRECFRQLMLREHPIFYILDNELREDRFRAVCDLFEMAGVSVTSPALTGPAWAAAEQRLAGCLNLGLHVAYVERDASVNHLDEAQSMARGVPCVATFRNLAPTEPSFSLIVSNGGAGAATPKSEVSSDAASVANATAPRTATWADVKPLAESIFRIWSGGGDLRWAEEAWRHLSRLGLSSYSTSLERALVDIRLMTLGSFYLDWCAVACDERQDDDASSWLEASDILPVQLGQLVGPEEDLEAEELGASGLTTGAANLLIRRQRPQVVETLLKGFGDANGLFVSLWRSAKSDEDEWLDDDDEDRPPPVSDWDILNDVTDEKLAAYQWIDGGCEQLGPERCHSDFD